MRTTKASEIKLNHVITAWAGHSHHAPSNPAVVRKMTSAERTWWTFVLVAASFLAGAAYLGLLP